MLLPKDLSDLTKILLLLLSHEAEKIDAAVGISPLVVVPGDELEEALLTGEVILQGSERIED